jgi:hypothetical protein
MSPRQFGICQKGLAMTAKLTDQQLYAEFAELLRQMPAQATLHHPTLENQEWLGRATALVRLADPRRATFFQSDVDILCTMIVNPPDQIQKILTTLHGFHYEWRLKCVGAMAMVFDAGQPFDYFDQVRRVIEVATTDLLFVDAYINSDFVASYLPHVRDGVQVRLLISNYAAEVRSSVDAYLLQRDLDIQIRRGKPHDRTVFIDKTQCWQSGSSFKDGAKKAPVILIQMIDAFDAVHAICEKQWDDATPV